MSKQTKRWLFTAAALTVTGLLIFTVVMTVCRWDFSRLGTINYQTNTYTVNESFENIRIEAETADILLQPSDDGQCRVICLEPENGRHTITVRDGTLTVCKADSQKWYAYIGIATKAPSVTVCLPQTEYASLVVTGTTGNMDIPRDFRFQTVDVTVTTGDIRNRASASEAVKLHASTGDILTEDVSVGALDMETTTGDITATAVQCSGNLTLRITTGDTHLTDVSCREVLSVGTTGTIAFRNVTATNRFSVESTTGSVTLNGCEAADIFIKTSTGDVFGTWLSEKIFIPQTGTGHIDVPHTVTGGKCEIITGTGDIRMSIAS